MAATPSLTRYSIQELIAVGGMAEVYLARQEGAGGMSRSIALKRIAPNLSHDPEFASMFAAEARVASLFSHPNVVTVYDFDRDEAGNLFLAMELVRGMDLHQLLVRLREHDLRLDARIATYIAGCILKGLSHVHTFASDGVAPGLVHRDVTPHNVLLSETGDVKLGDFGIVKAMAAATHTRRVRGKLAYMSPEQALGLPVDARSDLFAVGVLLFEMLAGRRPFDGSESHIMGQVAFRHPVSVRELNGDVSAELAALVGRLLHKTPRRRTSSAAQALRALESVPEHGSDGRARLARLMMIAAQTSAPLEVPGVTALSIRESRTRTILRPPRRARALSFLSLALILLAGIAWIAPRGRAAKSLGDHPVNEAAVPRLARDYFVRLRQVDFSRPFDVLGYVETAQGIARRVAPDAELSMFTADHVAAEGLAWPAENSIVYQFQSPSSRAEAFLSRIIVAISADGIYLGADSPVEGFNGVPLPPIHCSIAELWRRARIDRHQLANFILYRSGDGGPTTWFITAGAQIRTVPDDCGTTLGSVHP